MDEENAATSRGALETKKIKEILRENNLRLVDIKSDGDCLFNALAHQLNLVNSDSNSKFTGEFVRQTAANYMRNNSSEFIPFLDEEHANEYEGYCLRVEKPCQEGGDWGSATELKAASLALERPIKVINSDGLPHEFGEDFTSKPLTITFHRYLLTLGEHYNSTELIC
jgi:OTU domain-containing protein 6